MNIANPIYDVVFKYLMEDKKIAKLLISSIIGEEILELDFKPQELITDIETANKKKTTFKDRDEYTTIFTVYRLDFSAKIKTPEGTKQVIIELQKAKFYTDIMRFRKYLGEQLSDKNNIQKEIINHKERSIGIPIITIYFLGHKLDYTTASVIKVNREYIDLITNKPIKKKESFIESLTIDSYIIQIPYLTTKRRNELEVLLSVFDQSNVIDSDRHILNINESDYPEKYHTIIRRLRIAIESSDIKKKMFVEDTIIDELSDKERQIERLEEERKKAIDEQIETQKAKDKSDLLRERAEEEKEKMRLENELLKKEIEKLKGKK